MIICRTPLRVSFFGGGTDYPIWYENNIGITLSVTINKFSYIMIRELPPFFKFKHRIRYYLKEEVNSLDEIKHPVVREAFKLLDIKKGLEVVHTSDLPARSGLGSSSTFTVGLLHSLNALKNIMLTKRELALNAIHLEQNIIGESVGSQDQTIAAFGGFNFIEYTKSKTIHVEEVLTTKERYQSLQDNLLLCFTGFSRTAEKIAKKQIEITHLKEKELFSMLEITKEAKELIINNRASLDDFGKLLNEQWLIKKSLTNYISNKDIDEIYNTAINAGAIGGKLLGAGGGGFMLFYAKKDKHEKIKESLKNKLFVPFRFVESGSQIVYFSHD